MKILYPFFFLMVSLFCFAPDLSGQQEEQIPARFFGMFDKKIKDQSLRQKGFKPNFSANNTYQPVPNQRSCFTMEAEELLRIQYPEMWTLDDFEALLQEYILEYEENSQIRGSQIITIPVIVHVVHNGQPIGVGPNISEAQVISQLDVLNEDYRRMGAGWNNHPDGADIEIQFAPALVDPDGKFLSSPGINRVNGGRSFWEFESIQTTLKPNTIWDPTRYLNMWTVEFGGDSKNLLGYAQFPSFSGLPGFEQNQGLPTTDGVVSGYNYFGRVGNLDAPYDLGRTMTHEVGHWLGLRHIWGDGDCSVDDFCSDTPLAGKPNFGCRASNTCGTPTGDMIQNYMDYSDDFCMNIFTNCQKTRIRTVLDRSPRRKELKESTVHLGGGNQSAPIATFTVDKQNICAGQSVAFTGGNTNNPTSWTWKFFDVDNNLLATFQGRNQNIRFDNPGIYSVELTVSNSSGTTSKLEKNFIGVLGGGSLTELIENVEQQPFFPNWLVFNPDADRTWAIANVSSYGEGARSVVMDNYSTETDPTGTLDALITPRLNFSQIQFPYLYFEHAYAQFDEEYSDTLVLFYSLDCGNTFTPFWFRGGKELSTAPPTKNRFIPRADQWEWNQISLHFLAGQPSVHIAIANLSGWGNNLYLDELSFVNILNYTNRGPVANFEVGSRRVCQGDLVFFTDKSQAFPLQWQWQFPGGLPSSSNEQHPIVRYNNPGTYAVSLGVANTLGNDFKTLNGFIEVVPLPNISVNASQLPVCSGQPVTLTASGASRYFWIDQRSGNVIFEGPSVQVTLFENWSFIVIGENSAGCQRAEEFQVIVNAPPKPTISQNGRILSCSFAASYQWYLNGSPINGATGQTHMAVATGFYTVEIFNQQGCSSFSDPVFIDLSTHVTDVAIEDFAWKVFPNPNSGIFDISLDGTLSKDALLVLIDALGREVYRWGYQELIASNQGVLRVDLKHAIGGVYHAVLRTHGKFYSHRIVVIP